MKAKKRVGKFAPLFRVDAGRGTFETDDADEAYSKAYGIPNVVVEKNDETGSVEDSAYFSPKHPLWSREKFLKWARSRGRKASRTLRQRFSK